MVLHERKEAHSGVDAWLKTPGPKITQPTEDYLLLFIKAFVSNNISGRRLYLPRRRTKKIKQRTSDLLTVAAGRHSTSSDENCEKSKDNGLS